MDRIDNRVVQSNDNLLNSFANDALRNQSLNAVGSVSATGQGQLMAVASPLDVVPVTYSAVGANRPVSNLTGLAKSGVQALLNKFPGASRVLTPLLNLIPSGAKAGASDPLRLEVNTDFKDGSNVLHVKLNIGQLMRLGKPGSDEIFAKLLSTAGPAQKAELEYYKRIFDSGFGKPGFSESQFAKTTDIRLTFDPVKPDGFRVGLLTIPVINKFGDSGALGALAISPRVKFDKEGKPAGFQMIVGYEVDSPDTKSGFWAGVGAGVLVQWNGGLDQSPIRKNTQGQLGIEINLDGKARFMPVPGLRDTISIMQMGDVNAIRASSAPSVSSKDIATNLLKTNDPKVIAGLQQGAKLAEQTGNVIDTAVKVAGTVSQIASVGAAIAGISLTGMLAAAGLSVGIAFLWQDSVGDGTITGHHQRVYKDDTKTAYQALKTINALLNKPTALTITEGQNMRAALGQIKAISKKWASNPALKDFYNKLPTDQKFPFQPKHVQHLEQLVKVKLHRPDLD